MSPDKTPEERLGILETMQDEYMKRVERLENKLIGVLGFGIILLLGMVANIAIALIKK